ncbi:MAG: helix-hairpin-helix domain-containing protein [Aerococcus urinaeequi]
MSRESLYRILIFVILALTFFASVMAHVYGGSADNVNTININVGQPEVKGVSGVNINNGSYEALKSLPGIGDVLARKIIDGRPYDDIYDLMRVEGIGKGAVETLKDKVVW